MKLIDVISLISDSAEVRIYEAEGKEVARYDGKDSIPEELNDLFVDNIGAYMDSKDGKTMYPYILIELV